jgi:hypothetical protein
MTKQTSTQKDEELSGLEIGIALAAIRPLATDIYDAAKNFCGDRIKKTNASRLVACLSNRAKDISQVKTLLCLEQPVLITDFYSSQHVIDPSGNRVPVTSPEVLREHRRVVLAGVAGQGKSILFRYLALHDIANKKLPLFIELRNFEHTKSLRELLLSEIETLGFPKDEVVLDYLLEKGECTLYLDAFDEVPYSLQTQARKQIEDIARKHIPCSIFISTRPTLSIEASNHFRVFRLDNLMPQEAKSALRRMCSEKDDVSIVETELEKANHRIAKLLTTPLMVALLLLHHRLSGEFPETEQAFFGDLFDVLLRRHDQTKGYLRKRHSNASEIELLDLFGYSSFATRQKGVIDIQRGALIQICEEAKEFYSKSYDASGALQDIIEGTNLLLEEGASCRFAHKAVQEFYAAKFLSAQPEDNVQQFLRNRIRKWDHWEQMLEFIELINPHMFYKHFLIPHAGWIAFGDEEKRIGEGWMPGKKVYQTVFGADTIGIRDKGLFLFGAGHVSKFYLMRQDRRLPQVLSEIARELDWNEIPEEDREESDAVEFHPWTNGKNDVKFYRLGYLLEQKCGDFVRTQLTPVLHAAFAEIDTAYKFVAHRAEKKDFFA